MRNIFGQCLNNFARRSTGSHPLFISIEGRQKGLEIGRKCLLNAGGKSIGFSGVFLFILAKSVLPVLIYLFSLILCLAEVLERLIRNIKFLLKLPSQILLGLFDFLFPQGRAVGSSAVLFIRTAKTDMGAAANKRRLIGNLLCFLDGLFYGLSVMSVNFYGVPAVGIKASGHIFGTGQIGTPIDRNIIIII